MYDDHTSILIDVREDTVGAPVVLPVRLAAPRSVIPISGRPPLGVSDAVKLLLKLGSSLTVKRLKRRLETALEANVVGHGSSATQPEP